MDPLTPEDRRACARALERAAALTEARECRGLRAGWRSFEGLRGDGAGLAQQVRRFAGLGDEPLDDLDGLLGGALDLRVEPRRFGEWEVSAVALSDAGGRALLYDHTVDGATGAAILARGLFHALFHALFDRCPVVLSTQDWFAGPTAAQGEAFAGELLLPATLTGNGFRFAESLLARTLPPGTLPLTDALHAVRELGSRHGAAWELVARRLAALGYVAPGDRDALLRLSGAIEARTQVSRHTPRRDWRLQRVQEAVEAGALTPDRAAVLLGSGEDGSDH